MLISCLCSFVFVNSLQIQSADVEKELTIIKGTEFNIFLGLKLKCGAREV